jgi:hypothetical protein
MRLIAAATITFVLALLTPVPARAQSQAQASGTSTVTASVPRLITVTGTYHPASGLPAAATASVTVAVYAERADPEPLWQETQDVLLDATGRYTVQLGATSPDGLPLTLFAEGQERWLGVQFAGPGETERQRTRLTSVPYALRSADADTLGGHPASAYVLAPTGDAATDSLTAAATTSASASTTNGVLGGAANFLAKYVDGIDVGPSAVVDVGGAVGIGTTAPLDLLHVRFTNNAGSVTGFAVQNLGNTNASYSGMLFYDQNGALGQFQGFNNVTHEYRINNIARNGAAQFDGSINFMTGGVSKFLVAPTGNVGIGTTSPTALLEVSNALSGVPSNVWVSSYTNFLGPYYLARRARGTAAAPTAVQNGDGLSGLYGMGYGATQFGPASTGGITIEAAQNFTDTQQATAIQFSTTAFNSTSPATRMTLDASGNLGLGTTHPNASLEIASTPANSPASFVVSTYANAPGGSIIQGRKARGTLAAPSAAQSNDILASFSAEGYGATGFGIGARGGMAVTAAENWTDTAQGTKTSLATTATGTNVGQIRLMIDPSGNIGMGTTTPNAPLEISRTGANAAIVSTLYTNGVDAGAFVATQTARGTAAAPTAVQAGDFLGAFLLGGYGTTSFQEAAVVGALAAENFTDAAHGTAIGLGTTPLGGNDSVIGLALLPSGNVGIGTPADANGIPTATDKLQVFGDIRVGDSGTNGCVKNFAGTQLTGTCVSDRRYKKGITPFRAALDRVAALQPVHFYWRADQFPEQHFGDSQAYGLIAQDVEQVLPELVVTREDGYKAIDYSKLPLLTIQAVKELKAENDDLKKRVAELEALTQQIVDLQRLLKEMQRHTSGGR